MRSILVLAGALVFAGCISDVPAATPSPDASAATGTAPLAAPVTVYEATIAFTIGTTGTMPLEMPAAAQSFTLAVEWTSDAPATVTGGARIDVVDAAGDVVANCGYAVGASQPAEQACEQTSSLGNGPYELSWEGTGAVDANVLVTAQ